MKLADLHCDTPFELYKKKESLSENSLHISLCRAKSFENYLQVADVWSDKRKSDDECFIDFFKISDYFINEAKDFLCTSKEDIAEKKPVSFVLAVEDARLLSGDTSKLNTLYDAGVRLLTLCWSGISCIGGAWNTDCGLTDFGIDVVHKCFELGIIPDVSHGSRAVISETAAISRIYKKPFCATHSNSYSVKEHLRNLTDDDFHLIANFAGVVGISLCPEHLRGDACEISDIIRHIGHYISVGGEDFICLGCDFDGVSSLPSKIEDISSLEKLYDAAVRTFGSTAADKLFYNNAYNFLLNYIDG